MIVGVKVVQVEPSSREAPTAIDTAIKQLEILRRATERRMQALGSIRAEVTRLANLQIPDIAYLKQAEATTRKQQDDLKVRVAEEQARLADARRQQAELKEKSEQLRALAALALKHLADHCPVCEQTYDREATRSRLEGLAKGEPGDAPAVSGLPDRLTDLLAQLAAKDKEVASAEEAVRSGEQTFAGAQAIQTSIGKRLDEIGITATERRDAMIQKAVSDAEATLASVIDLQRDGESLALLLAQFSAAATLEDLRREAVALRKDYEDRERSILARNKTGDLAQKVIEALREAASAVVEERLREITPLLQSIWSRIDPHPAFRIVAFFSQVFRGKGQLSTMLSDPVEEKESGLPASILSSSQMNALAVSVFLALNVGISRPPLSVAMLDDPLQSLDDVNLLGLVDLFRRTRGRRQLLISTHDGRFGSLLSRKLRPANEAGRTIVVELDGWGRRGPIVTTREVKSDPVRLRLVS